MAKILTFLQKNDGFRNKKSSTKGTAFDLKIGFAF
jgi:hypothetical protein